MLWRDTRPYESFVGKTACNVPKSIILDGANDMCARAMGGELLKLRIDWKSTGRAGGNQQVPRKYFRKPRDNWVLLQSRAKCLAFVALVALLGAMPCVKMALGALWKRSPSWLLFAAVPIFIGGGVSDHQVGSPPDVHVNLLVCGHQTWVSYQGLALGTSVGIRSSSGSRFQRIVIGSQKTKTLVVAVSGVPGDGSRVNTHDHDGYEAPNESPDSILSKDGSNGDVHSSGDECVGGGPVHLARRSPQRCGDSEIVVMVIE
ncbi:hypothetical protein Tco_1419985 [Tanacetum coccineum]